MLTSYIYKLTLLVDIGIYLYFYLYCTNIHLVPIYSLQIVGISMLLHCTSYSPLPRVNMPFCLVRPSRTSFLVSISSTSFLSLSPYLADFFPLIESICPGLLSSTLSLYPPNFFSLSESIQTSFLSQSVSPRILFYFH